MNTLSSTSSKDHKLLEILGQSAGASQRELAEKSGFSLGMVNLILRRLAKTGYIKVANLNRGRISYLLTAKAMAEKSRQSYNYLVRTIRIYEQYREQLNQLIDKHLSLGQKCFVVYGEGDLADLLKVLLKTRGDALSFRPIVPNSTEQARTGEIVLNCCLDGDQPLVGISILEAILNHDYLEKESVISA